MVYRLKREELKKAENGSIKDYFEKIETEPTKNETINELGVNIKRGPRFNGRRYTGDDTNQKSIQKFLDDTIKYKKNRTNIIKYYTQCEEQVTQYAIEANKNFDNKEDLDEKRVLDKSTGGDKGIGTTQTKIAVFEKDDKLYKQCTQTTFTVANVAEKTWNRKHKPTSKKKLKGIKIPGTIQSSFLLEDDGFKIEEIAVTNFVLRKLMLSDTYNPTAHDLQLAEAEENFRNTIADIYDYGMELKKEKNIDAEQVAKQLAQDLSDLSDTFFLTEKITAENTKEYLQSCHEKIVKADDVLKDYRGWKSVIGNALIALTFVGLIFLSAKALHSFATAGNLTLFFQTDDAEKINRVRKDLKNIAKAAVAGMPQAFQTNLRPR